MKEYLDKNIIEIPVDNDPEVPFRAAFFRIYDRKIASGEIKFSQMGMKKADFINLCTDKDFIPPRDRIIDMCIQLKLTRDEAIDLLATAGYMLKE